MTYLEKALKVFDDKFLDKLNAYTYEVAKEAFILGLGLGIASMMEED